MDGDAGRIRPLASPRYVRSVHCQAQCSCLGEPALYIDAHNRYKHDKGRDSRTKELFKFLGVKLVVDRSHACTSACKYICFSEGNQKYYGCSKGSARCFGTIKACLQCFEFVHNHDHTSRTTCRHLCMKAGSRRRAVCSI